jgi:hypothetical protein
METRGVKLGIPPVKRLQLKLIFLLHLNFTAWALLYPWVSTVGVYHRAGREGCLSLVSPSPANIGRNNYAPPHPLSFLCETAASGVNTVGARDVYSTVSLSQLT